MDADRLVGEAQAKFRNVLAVLDMIKATEGTNFPNGHRYMFGSSPQHEILFDDMSQHPNHKVPFRQKDGTTSYTTAAGWFQMIFRTWERQRIKLTLPDYDKESQERAAISIIQERGQLQVVEAGRLKDAIDVLWVEWASLPASQYNQPRRTFEFAVNAYESAGGVMA